MHGLTCNVAADFWMSQLRKKDTIVTLLSRIFSHGLVALPGLEPNQWSLNSKSFEAGWLQFRALDILCSLLHPISRHRVAPGCIACLEPLYDLQVWELSSLHPQSSIVRTVIARAHSFSSDWSSLTAQHLLS